MSEAFSVWWSNPITAALLAGAGLLLLACAVTGFVAVVRLGAIQLGGLLSHRGDLLPGFSRRGDGHPTLVVALLFAVGLVWAVFALALMRAVRLAGGGSVPALALLLAGWALAIAIAMLAARGSRVEPLAVLGLTALRPATRLLIRVAGLDDAQEEPGDEEEAVDEHEVQAFIGAGEEAGILEHEDAELIASIVDFSDTVAREIMTPRTDIVALSVDTSFDAVERRFAESMFTRIPVYRETLDRIEGVLHVKDVLRSVSGGGPGRRWPSCCGRCWWSPRRSPCASCCASSRAATSSWRWWSTSTAAPRGSSRSRTSSRRSSARSRTSTSARRPRCSRRPTASTSSTAAPTSRCWRSCSASRSGTSGSTRSPGWCSIGSGASRGRGRR